MQQDRITSSDSTLGTTVLGEGIEEVNVLHISDLHFGLGKNTEEKEIYRNHRKRLIKNLINKLYDYNDQYGLWRPDIVVISGDIAYTGKSEEYSQFYEDFFSLLTSENDDVRLIIDPDCIVICPGNHDVLRDVYNDCSVEEFETVFKTPLNRAQKSDNYIGSELTPIPLDFKKIYRSHFATKDAPRAKPFSDYIDACCGRDADKLVRLHVPEKWGWVHFAVLNSAWDSRDDKKRGSDEGRLRVGLNLYQSIYDEFETRIEKHSDSILCTVFHHPIESIEEYTRDGNAATYEWLAPSERKSDRRHGACFAKTVRATSKCIMNGHVHEAHHMQYLGNGAQMAAWSVCGSTLSRENPVYHCRVIKFRRRMGMVHYCDCTSPEDDPTGGWKLTTGPVSEATDEIQFIKMKARSELHRRFVETNNLLKNSEVSDRQRALLEIVSDIFNQAVNFYTVDTELMDMELQILEQEQENAKSLTRKKTGE